MSIEQFLKKENISMLWDVISDEQIFNFLPRDSQSQVLLLKAAGKLQSKIELERSSELHLELKN